jgi:GAF domain-containing protein
VEQAKDDLAAGAVRDGDEDMIRAILVEVCRITHSGFAAVARVTEDRWIACQVADQVDFGLKPGDELDIQKTICTEIRQCGQEVVIDHVGADPEWRTHPVPAMYGFQAYASLPICLSDGSFYGTLCTLDASPRALSARATIGVLRRHAQRIGELLSVKHLQAEAPRHASA